jgi:CheY-like chemotaxis protein
MNKSAKENSSMAPAAYILIVEDDADIAEAMRIILEGGGYEVGWAMDSDEAWQKIREKHPELIILDVMMRTPDEGFQLAYQLKNDPRYAPIPVLVITSVAQKTGFSFSPQSDGDFLPVEGFIEKPVQPQQLLENISRLLADKT